MMSSGWLLPAITAILILLLLAGTPIFIAFLLAAELALLAWFGWPGSVLLVNSLIDTATTGALATVPLFILMGEILFRSGCTEVLFDSVDRLVGRVRGRQYLLTMSVSTVFGALSGSAVAVTAMLGRSVLPTMLASGCDRRLSAGTVLAGASLAPIIPPSILVILVGSLANQSISKLLIAGVIPGVLIAVLCVLYILTRIGLDPSLASRDTSRRPQRQTVDLSIVRAFVNMLPFSIVIFAVLGMILLGVATPSESASLGVVGAVLVAALYGQLTWRLLWKSARAAVLIGAMLLAILAMSKLFGQLLAFTGITQSLISAVSQWELSPVVMFVLMMAIPFVACMFLDQMAVILVLIPLYEPIIRSLGFDSTWFWVLLLINLSLGSITPPFGYTLFALKGTRPELSMREIYASAWAFVAVFLVAITIMAAVPAIVTWLPSRFYG
jgi:tripartite ATP-independent transporter DctM subunit